ncbi:S-adenosylmethionine-dependent methyltransferase [Pseudogymnoascus australis]
MEKTKAPPQGVEEGKQYIVEAGAGEAIARLYLSSPPQDAKALKTWLESAGFFYPAEKIIPIPSSTASASASADGTRLRIPTTILLPASTSPAEARKTLSLSPLESGLTEGISIVLLPVKSTSNSLEERGAQGKDTNPLLASFRGFLSHPAISALVNIEAREGLLASVPKRWTVYAPLVLLPTGSLSSEAWREVLEHAPREAVEELWQGVLDAIARVGGGEKVTHLAINHPIPGSEEDENVIRAPSHLRMLLGDFGPAISAQRWALGPGSPGKEAGTGGVEGESEGDGEGRIGERDFERAFWVRTRQNGIFQSWAPRWTMFSRGNVTEKARVLSFGAASTWSSDEGDGEEVQIAVDLYAGIGYFTLSYLSLGYAVLAWEINPFSIEGLRRGAVRNGFEVLVVKGAPDWEAVREVVKRKGVVVFAEDNRGAWERFQEGLRALGGLGSGRWKVRHVNLGLLPSSRMGWNVGGGFLGGGEGGWMHVHENIKKGERKRKKGEERLLGL